MSGLAIQAGFFRPPPAVGGGSPFDVFGETFSGSEVDSQSQSGYDLTGWISDSATNTISAGRLTLPGVTRDVYRVLDTALGDIWVYWPCQAGGANVSQQTFLQLQDASGSEIARVRGRTNTKEWEIAHGSTVLESTGDPWSDPTLEWHYWLHYVAGAGSDGVLTLYASLDGVQGSPILSITTGTATADVARVAMFGPTNMSFGAIGAATTNPGDNPTF